jgi:rhodanese-related sulfurtransferase
MRALIFALLALASCSRSEPAAQPASTSVVKDPQKARELIAQGAVVLDVRTPDEFGAGHLPTATNLPIDSFGDHLADVDKLATGDKAKPIVVYCGHGRRAAKAKEQLDAAGYRNVVNGGGYDDLK